MAQKPARGRPALPGNDDAIEPGRRAGNRDRIRTMNPPELSSAPDPVPTPAETPTSRRAGRGAPAHLVRLMAAVFLLVVWSFVAWWAASSRQESIDRTEQVLQRLDHAVGEQTRRLFATVDLFLGVADRWIDDNPGADPRTDPRFLGLVDIFRKRTDQAIDIQLASETGRLMPLGGSGPAGPQSVGDTDWFQRAMNGGHSGNGAGRFVVGVPQTGGAGSLWRIPVARRLSRAHHGVAALVASIELPALLSLYEGERIHPDGAIVLLRRDGVLLARSPHEDWLLGQSLAGGQLYRDFLPRGERGFVLLARTATDAKEKYAAYSVLADFPLLTVVSTATDDVFAAWRRQLLIIVVLALAVSMATVVVVRHLTRLLTAVSLHTAELAHLASTDPMTGAHNRPHFLSLLQGEFERGQRYRATLSLMVLDLDFFKQINDGYGHAAGDAALRAFAAAASGCLRGMDAFGRLGGEEFGILLPSTGIAQAETVAERIRDAVAGIAIDTELGTVRFTTSIGVTQTIEGDATIDVLLARADAALHAAKAGGRNRVIARAA